MLLFYVNTDCSLLSSTDREGSVAFSMRSELRLITGDQFQRERKQEESQPGSPLEMVNYKFIL